MGNRFTTAEPPLVSFVIPTLNNEDTIERCLRSIIEQDYPNKEIIVIDGHSTDRTLAIAKQYTTKFFWDLGTYGSACQTGIDKARGEIVALFDSDLIIPHRDWLKNAVRYFNYDDRVSSVWPLYRAPPGSPGVEHLYQTSLYRILMEDRIRKNRSVFGGGNTLFLKSALLEIGGVDRSIHWGADFDWAMKLKERGYKVIFIDDPLWHDTMRTIGQFYRKQFAGANTFTRAGFEMMGLSFRDIVYENFVLGTKGMLRGLFVDRDLSWLWYPVMLGIRVFAYGTTLTKNVVRGRAGATG